MLAACLAGQGIMQAFELYTRELVADGRLVQVLPEWAEETYPLYVYRHPAQLMSAKVRAFSEFVGSLGSCRSRIVMSHVLFGALLEMPDQARRARASRRTDGGERQFRAIVAIG